MKKTTPILLLFAALACALTAVSCKTLVLDLTQPNDIARLYRMRCASCHSLVAPDEYDAEDWPEILDEYGPRSGLKPKERAALEPWLIERAHR